MKRLLSTLTTIAVVAPVAVLLQGPATSAAAAASPDRTNFAFSASGFGTRVNGGQVPAGSDTTAYQAMGCTNVAGRDADNHLTQATIPGLGTASEIDTDLWTTRRGDVVASHARNSIERIVIGEANLGTLEINAVSTTVHAIHGPNGFVARSSSRIGSLVYTDPTGAEQELEIPAPGEPVTVPGLGELIIGHNVKRTDAHHAVATGNALVFRKAVSGTKVKIAHAAAEVADDVKHGLFNGRSDAVRGTLAQDNVSIGAQPLSLMPCQGTNGELLKKSTARVDITEGLVVHGLSSRLIGDQTRQKAFGYTQGRVGLVDIGDGQVTVEAIVGRVNVTRRGGDLERNIKGTSLGTIVINGEEAEFPDSDVIEVPGLVRLERNIVNKFANGMSVIALRITLLDGSGAVVNLGEARLLIRNAYL